MNLIGVFPREFNVRKTQGNTNLSQDQTSWYLHLVENIFQSSQSYSLHILFLTWTPQQRHKENRSKKKVISLRCSGAFRVDFYYCYEMISFICVSDICSVLGVAKRNMRQSAWQFFAWLGQSLKTKLSVSSKTLQR